MNKTTAWLHAFRLRTLPLAFSSIILGSLLAYSKGSFDLSVMLLAMITTLFLQILSNLANDYGDTVSGVDNVHRVGPSRSVQSGAISRNEMKAAIGIFTILALLTGIYLVVKATRNLDLSYGIFFILLGLLAIAAAIKYTVGKSPYGYKGLGDVSVFIFFGLTGVLGTYFLHSNSLNWKLVLPASSVGFLSVAVLNLNNMRDYENDKASGKNSLVVIMGETWAKKYHVVILSMAIICATLYTLINYHSHFQWVFMIILPVLIKNMNTVLKNQVQSELDEELKKIAISTLVFSVAFGAGLIY